jgi:hypothetical protein
MIELADISPNSSQPNILIISTTAYRFILNHVLRGSRLLNTGSVATQLHPTDPMPLLNHQKPTCRIERDAPRIPQVIGNNLDAEAGCN